MQYNELIEALCEYFELDYPEKDEHGKYKIYNEYDWISGCSFGRSGAWLTLENVVEALGCFIED